MPAAFIAIFAGFVLIVALFGYLNYRAAKKRREALAALAAQRGWTFAVNDNRYADRFTGPPFGTGENRSAANVLTGRHDDRGFVAFDYSYETTEMRTDTEGHMHSETEVHRYSVIALDLAVSTPQLSVTPERLVGRLFGRLTNTDIQLESEQFNHAFTVHCPDRKFATDVLHPRMMEYLLTQPDLAWSLRDASLLTVRPGQHSIQTLEATLVATDGIVDRIPEFVWHELGDGTVG